MAGLEVVVRPVIFPNIRPQPRQSLPPQDDPEKGFAVIKGQPAQGVGTNYSMSISSSKSKPREVERRFDEVRVYQEQDDGTINKDNFVDVEVANRITMSKPRAPYGWWPADVQSVSGSNDLEENFYQKVPETPSIEILRRDIIKKDEDIP